ncbi:hypothetical protein P0136_07210 [Lentisphaerota bacterium ZTH]|nr:hypothetical protein JYG24_01675 [Lentisphaerota bacterium]WET05156.1 hypothetical protein P0136_07210 [Lentisphaerota bacterium ZTH]
MKRMTYFLIAALTVSVLLPLKGEEAKTTQKVRTNSIAIENSAYIKNLDKQYRLNKGFRGQGMSKIWDFAELNFDNGYTLTAPETKKQIRIALFYIRVKVKTEACPPLITKFWNYNQIPVIIVNYACNITGFDSQGILQTTAGDVNSHFYYAVKDPSFKNKTRASIAVFGLWPGIDIKICQPDPNMMFKCKSDGNYYIKARTTKFKVNQPVPPGTSKFRMLVPFQS